VSVKQPGKNMPAGCLAPGRAAARHEPHQEPL